MTLSFIASINPQRQSLLPPSGQIVSLTCLAIPNTLASDPLTWAHSFFFQLKLIRQDYHPFLSCKVEVLLPGTSQGKFWDLVQYTSRCWTCSAKPWELYSTQNSPSNSTSIHPPNSPSSSSNPTWRLQQGLWLRSICQEPCCQGSYKNFAWPQTLHWPPVKHCISLEIFFLHYTVLKTEAPAQLDELLHPPSLVLWSLLLEGWPTCIPLVNHPYSIAPDVLLLVKKQRETAFKNVDVCQLQ